MVALLSNAQHYDYGDEALNINKYEINTYAKNNKELPAQVDYYTGKLGIDGLQLRAIKNDPKEIPQTPDENIIKKKVGSNSFILTAQSGSITTGFTIEIHGLTLLLGKRKIKLGDDLKSITSSLNRGFHTTSKNTVYIFYDEARLSFCFNESDILTGIYFSSNQY